jgi:hypothetical protein
MITKDDSMAMLRFMLSFVTSLQDECRTYHAMRRHVLIDGIRARNPRFLMPHFGQKTGFRARMNEIKSGIPCSGWDAIFCNKFAR